MSKKVLLATEKPFAPAAAAEVEAILTKQGYDVVRLEKYKSKADLLQAVADAHAMIVRSDVVDPEVLEAGKQLKIVVRAGAGYDNVNCAAAKAKGVVVENTPGQNANAVAELAIGLMLYMARNQFNGSSGTELKGKTLGLLGFGAVGKRVGDLGKAFGMEVVSLDPFVDAACMERAGVCHRCEISQVFGEADYVSLHLPANAETKGCVGYDHFKAMKPGACLVNTARAEVIDEQGMIKAYTERSDLRYVSDIAPKNAAVFLETFPGRVYFTPKKMGAQTEEANVNAGIAAAHQIIAFFEKGDTTFQVNK